MSVLKTSMRLRALVCMLCIHSMLDFSGVMIGEHYGALRGESLILRAIYEEHVKLVVSVSNAMRPSGTATSFNFSIHIVVSKTSMRSHNEWSDEMTGSLSDCRSTRKKSNFNVRKLRR